jgi:hypothetical protein
MNVVSAYHHTKPQLERAFVEWGVPETKLPRKGQAVFIAFPVAQGPSARVTWTEHKTPDGKERLFLLEWFN